MQANVVDSASVVLRGPKVICVSFIKFWPPFLDPSGNTSLKFGQVDYLLLLKPISLDNAVQEFSFA